MHDSVVMDPSESHQKLFDHRSLMLVRKSQEVLNFSPI
jgi:hypothetical protein